MVGQVSVLAALLLIAGRAYAVDRYVDAVVGDDGCGDGTSGNPWLTLQWAVDNSSNGDKIWVTGNGMTNKFGKVTVNNLTNLT